MPYYRRALCITCLLWLPSMLLLSLLLCMTCVDALGQAGQKRGLVPNASSGRQSWLDPFLDLHLLLGSCPFPKVYLKQPVGAGKACWAMGNVGCKDGLYLGI